MRVWVLVGLLFLQYPVRADTYDEGDWVTYGDFRYITAILPVRNHIFIATTNGILRYDTRFNMWQYPYTTSTGMPAELFSIAGYEDFGDILWITTPAPAVYRHKTIFKRWEKVYSPDSWGVKPDLTIPHLPLYTIIHPGMLMFDAAGEYLEDRHFNRFSVTAVAESDAFDRWIGFHGMGCGVVKNNTARMEMVPYGLNRKGAETIFFDAVDTTFWISGITPEKSGGITRWDTESDTWYHYEADNIDRVDHDAVYAMAADAHSIWMATAGGVLRWNRADDSFRMLTDFDGLTHEKVTSLALDGDTLWAGTYRGITCISLLSGLITGEDERLVKNSEVYDMAVVQDKVFALTSEGLVMFSRHNKKGKWSSIKDPKGRIAFDCRVLEEDGSILICTGRDLLALYHTENGVWEYLQDPDAMVYAVATDTINLWLGTSEGVYKYRKGTTLRKHFTVHDGLPHAAVHSIILHDEYVWFGTEKGMTRFRWHAQHRTD